MESNTGSTRDIFSPEDHYRASSWDAARISIRALHISKRSRTTIARHMGLSSSRKFDVLTVSRRGKEVEKNIYRVTFSHMARDKNAMLAVSQLARLCERIMLGRNEMAHLMCRRKG